MSRPAVSSSSGSAPLRGGTSPRAASRRQQVFLALRTSSTPLGVIELAEGLGVHPNTVRFHLETLVQAGRVQRVPGASAGRGRPALLYRASGGMDPTGPRNYQLLAGMLVDQLAAEPDPAGRAIAAGRAWGRQLAQPAPAGRGRRPSAAVDQLVGLLAELGFEPEKRTSRGGDGEIALRNCPFLELVESRTQVVCPLHLGLMQGVTGAAYSPVTVNRLEPFVEPGLCLAHLGPAPADGVSTSLGAEPEAGRPQGG